MCIIANNVYQIRFCKNHNTKAFLFIVRFFWWQFQCIFLAKPPKFLFRNAWFDLALVGWIFYNDVIDNDNQGVLHHGQDHLFVTHNYIANKLMYKIFSNQWHLQPHEAKDSYFLSPNGFHHNQGTPKGLSHAKDCNSQNSNITNFSFHLRS
jgi:hypothetical protein